MATVADSSDREERRVSVVLFPGFELLDVFGPVELFSQVPGMAVDVVGPRVGPVASSHGCEVVAQRAYDDLGAPDILLVPGGMGTRTLVHDAGFVTWLRHIGEQSSLVTSVCTGSALLAAAGLLDGYRATSNKLAFRWVSGFGSSVEWVASARWVHDRDRWTSSGVAAGMDMAAALITDLCGAETALAATRWAEYEPHSDPDLDPFAQLHGLV